jgi:hypothetical protein
MAGYWTGFTDGRESDGPREMVALIDADGESHWIVERGGQDDDDEKARDFVIHGNVCCGTRFDAGLAGRERLSTRRRGARLEVTLERSSLRGRIEFRDRKYDFALERSAEYERGLTLQQLAGVYTGTGASLSDTPSTLTLTIDPGGRLTGADSSGCIYNGSASIPDTAHDMVRLQLELASCGSLDSSSPQWNGSYSGLGLLLGGRVFYHSVIGPVWLGALSVER